MVEYSRIFGVFSSGVFAQNNSRVFFNLFFACFWHFKFLTPTDRMGYSLCKMADFKNRRIFQIFGVLSSGFFLEQL